MKRSDKINESIRQLSLLDSKGATNIYYYIDDGVPSFDVFIADTGVKINSMGKPIRCEVDEVDSLFSMLGSSLSQTLAKEGVVQVSLF